MILKRQDDIFVALGMDILWNYTASDVGRINPIIHGYFFSKALFFGYRDAAVTIINNENWMKVMKNKTWEQHRVTTPMRKLITKLPGRLVFMCNKFLISSSK